MPSTTRLDIGVEQSPTECPFLAPGAITGIAIVTGIILVMILIRAIICSKSRPKWCRNLGCCSHSDDSTSDEQVQDLDSPPEMIIFQQPPAYDECVNNPKYRKSLPEDIIKNGAPEKCLETNLPPSYERIEKGEFETIVITENKLVQKVRQFMMSKSREALNSSRNEAARSMEGSQENTGLTDRTSNVIVVQVDLESPQRDTTSNSPNQGLPEINDRSNVCRLGARVTSLHENRSHQVCRAGSNISSRSLPSYSELAHPPAYDNLSFYDDELLTDREESRSRMNSSEVINQETISEARTTSDNIFAEMNRNDLTYSRSVAQRVSSASVFRTESERLKNRIESQRVTPRRWSSQETLTNFPINDISSDETATQLNISRSRSCSDVSHPELFPESSRCHLESSRVSAEPSTSSQMQHSPDSCPNEVLIVSSL